MPTFSPILPKHPAIRHAALVTAFGMFVWLPWLVEALSLGSSNWLTVILWTNLAPGSLMHYGLMTVGLASVGRHDPWPLQALAFLGYWSLLLLPLGAIIGSTRGVSTPSGRLGRLLLIQVGLALLHVVLTLTLGRKLWGEF